MRKSIFRLASVLVIFLLIAITLAVGGRDETSIVTPQIQDKVNEASYQAQDRAKQEEARLASQFEEKPEPAPTPEPMPPIAELCMRMQWFDEMALWPGEKLSDFSRETRQEYYRAQSALIGALEYHLRQNPYGQSLGCSGRRYLESTVPSEYLADYVDVVPRGLILRLIKPEVADHLKILRAAATYDNLRSARSSIQGIRNSLKLTRRELIILGVTHREILEAEIKFIDDETGN